MPDLSAYFARVDAHLDTLDDAGKARFLERLSDQWSERYADFQHRIARGAPTSGVTSFDYIETIAGLDQRAGRRAREAA